MNLSTYLHIYCKEPFSFKKWFNNFFIKHRLKKAAIKFQNDIPYIERCIAEDSIGEEDRTFYWSQLVWQEISMYIRLGKKIEIDEFAWLCNRRGFTLNEQNYLQTMMGYVGLMK